MDLGARNGGLSLYFALKVICSDVSGPSLKAKKLHEKYHIHNIKYISLDATSIPPDYHQQFDVVTFKSVLGSIGSCENIEREVKTVSHIRECLKPGGLVVFAENLRGIPIYSFLRKCFRRYKWHYHSRESIHSLFKNFSLVDEFCCGVLGCLGPNEAWRRLLGTLDTYIFDRLFPDSWKYIGVFIYRLDET